MLSAIPLNFENANCRLGSLPLEIERLAKLIERRLAFLQIFLVFFGIDVGDDF